MASTGRRRCTNRSTGKHVTEVAFALRVSRSAAEPATKEILGIQLPAHGHPIFLSESQRLHDILPSQPISSGAEYDDTMPPDVLLLSWQNEAMTVFKHTWLDIHIRTLQNHPGLPL